MNDYSVYDIVKRNLLINRGEDMLLKTSKKQGSSGNVRYIHGSVRFNKVHLSVYCYEIDGVLIDTGSASLLAAFQPFFEEAPIDQAVITHFHEDHTGGARYLQDADDIPIYMNEASIDYCRQKADYPFYRKIFWGKRAPFTARPIGNTFTSRRASWQVIPTPGHAFDHLAFLNEETGQLFSGDLYVHPRTKVILREESIPQIIQSINHVLTFDFDEMYCCHAGFVKKGREAFQNKLHYLEELQGKVWQLNQKGYNKQEIHQTLFPKKYPITLFSFGEWHSKHMIASILNHK